MTYLKKDELESISVISKENIFDENSNSSFHTAYQAERLFYNCIKNGDYEKAKSTIDTLLSRTIITGRLSDDEIRQTKYFAVCCITLATRYAITGGLGEETAYNFSDSAIYETDKMQNKNLMKSIWHGKIMRHMEIALNYVEAWTNILMNY